MHMKLWSCVLSFLMLSCGMLAGCLDDGETNKEVVGIYGVNTTGSATSAHDDMLLQITLISSSTTIKFTDGSAVQQGEDYFGFGFEKIISTNEVSNHGCMHEDYNPKSDPGPEPDVQVSCLIVEDVNDKIWTVGETITLSENINASGICDTQCDLILTILNNEGGGPDALTEYISMENDEYSATFTIN